ncbi:hypothetical protein DJ56_4185 [Yersinia pestis]|nr:hypothetical protein DJ56_4185 [Yersinia pestis]
MAVPLTSKSKASISPVTLVALISSSVEPARSCSRIDTFVASGSVLSQLPEPVILTVPLFSARSVTVTTPLV